MTPGRLRPTIRGMTSIDPASTIPGMAPIHPAVRVGHVHLRVADLERSLAFYRDGLGFGVVADGRPIGLDAAFLAAGDYHHHVGLNTWESAGRRRRRPATPASTTSPSSTPTGASSPAPSSGCATTATRSTTPPTTAPPSPSTSTTPTATASSCTSTARARPGSTSTASPILKAERIPVDDI